MNYLLEMAELYMKLHKIKEENRCDAHKDVGDRVRVWDGSYSEDMDTGEHYAGIDPVFEDPVIIIEKNCENILDHDLFGKQNRDVVVYSPTHDRRIATRMDFCKLVNPDENERREAQAVEDERKTKDEQVQGIME